MSTKERIVINDRNDIPQFANEAEEAAFWEKHTWGEQAWQHAATTIPLPQKRSTSITLRMESDTLARLRLLADKKGMAYQTLLKNFVQERLYEEEKRHQLV